MKPADDARRQEPWRTSPGGPPASFFDRKADDAKVQEKIPDLTERTIHNRAKLKAWGVVPPDDAGEFFGFISQSEAEAINAVLRILEGQDGDEPDG